MRTSLPPLPALLAFEAVARRRSFALAASELHLTPSAISHQVTRLEEFLAVRLFERTTRGVELSAAGAAYLRRVSGALGAIGSATDDLRKGVRNSLYLHTTPSFASLWLMPRLPLFAQAHPGVSLFLSSSPTHSDFTLGHVDVDVRYGVANWPNLTVRPVFEESILPLASPSFITRHQLRDPEELLHAPLIESTVNIVQWSDWLESRDITSRPDRFALRFDRAQLSMDAAVQGLGIALESATLAQGHIEADRLRAVFDPAWSVPVQAHFVVYPPQHALRPEVAQFLTWLERQVAEGTQDRPPIP
jgi:DNA-binding transcriptional LysR family regulator